MKHFRALIRVIKSVRGDSAFGDETVMKIQPIMAESKEAVKQQLLLDYPQFFQNNKIYERETKDKAQFFYVVIYELFNWEIEMLNSGPWECSHCGHVHDNEFDSKQVKSKLFPDHKFCNYDNCFTSYKKKMFENVEMPDDMYHINADSLNYIYKITEKKTNKCYIGKTRNAPFFRWWNHLTKSSSPFGLALQKSKLSDWIFEVLEELPLETKESEVFRIESEYMIKYDSIRNGYNTTISNKETVKAEIDKKQPKLF